MCLNKTTASDRNSQFNSDPLSRESQDHAASLHKVRSVLAGGKAEDYETIRIVQHIETAAICLRQNAAAMALQSVLGTASDEVLGLTISKLIADEMSAYGLPKEPAAQQMVEHLVLLHQGFCQLFLKAFETDDPDKCREYHELARNLKAEHRRTALALRHFLEPPRQLHVIQQIQQQNLALSQAIADCITMTSQVHGPSNTSAHLVADDAPRIDETNGASKPSKSRTSTSKKKSGVSKVSSNGHASKKPELAANGHQPRFTIP